MTPRGGITDAKSSNGEDAGGKDRICATLDRWFRMTLIGQHPSLPARQPGRTSTLQGPRPERH